MDGLTTKVSFSVTEHLCCIGKRTWCVSYRSPFIRIINCLSEHARKKHTYMHQWTECITCLSLKYSRMGFLQSTLLDDWRLPDTVLIIWIKCYSEAVCWGVLLCQWTVVLTFCSSPVSPRKWWSSSMSLGTAKFVIVIILSGNDWMPFPEISCPS